MKTKGVIERRAVSYIRFSTPKQQHGFSLVRQLEGTKRFCQRHGLHLDESLTIKDLGKSAFRGANADSGNLAVFLEAIRNHKIPKGTVLVVEALDRLTRNNIVEASHLLTDILRNGVDVGMVTEDKVYSYEYINKNPFEFIVATTYLIRGGNESQTKSERVKDAWARKKKLIAEQKKAVKIPTPCWIRRTDDKWTVVKEKAAIVRRVFADYLSNGLGIWMLSQSLNSRKVPVITQRGKPGSKWHRITIHRMLTDKAVIGVYTKSDTPIPNYFPPIISETDFYAVQAKLKARRQYRGRHSLKDVSLFKGVCKCSKCGGTMTRVSRVRPVISNGKKVGKKLHRYLYCHNSILGTCSPAKCVDLTKLEEAFARYVMSSRTADAWFNRSEEVYNKLRGEIARVEGQILDTTVRRDRLVEMIELGAEDSPRVLVNRIKALETANKKLQLEKEKLTAELNQKSVTRSNLTEFRNAARATVTMKPDARLKMRELIRQFIVSMTLDAFEKKAVFTTIAGKTRELSWVNPRQTSDPEWSSI